MSNYQGLQPQATYTGEADPTQTIPSQSINDRRRYPREPKGVKNEWHALIRHQTEVNNQIAQREKELKYLRSQDLGQAYDQKFQEKIQSKEHQSKEKQIEENQMNASIAQYQQEVVRQKQIKQAMQSSLADSYDGLMQQHTDQKNGEKQRKLEIEIRHLDENKRKIESDQRRRLRAKQEFTNAAQDQISDFYHKKNLEKQNHVRFKDEYSQQVQKNIQRDVLKDENYRNHFKAIGHQQKHLEDIHVQTVLSDYQQRQQKIIQTIENRVAEADMKASQKEMQQRMDKQDAKNDLRSFLHNHLRLKAGLRESEKEIKMLEVEEGVKKSQDYEQFLQDSRVQKRFMQQHYKDILDKQQQAWEENQKMNRMTKHEKKLNSMDLQAYKNSDHKLHSLIHGLQHSRYDFTGSPALKKTAMRLSSSSTNLHEVSTQPSPMKNGREVSFDNARHATESLNNSRDHHQAPILLTTSSASPTPKNKMILSGNMNKILTSPTYRTSPHNILSSQLTNQYASPDPVSLFSAKKALADPANGDIFYRPPKHIPFNKIVSQQLSNPEHSRSLSQLHKPSASFTIDGNSSQHNPILNPLPYNMQNPYLLNPLKNNGRSSSEKRGSISNFTNINPFSLKAY